MSETGDIYRLIPQIMKAIGPIAKVRENASQHYKFRGIDDMYNAVQSPMAEAGVFCVPKLLDLQVSERPTRNDGILRFTTVRVQYLFCAGDGSSVEVIAPGEAFDSGDKSTNKAMSAAMKYAYMQLFCIPTQGDNDIENHSHEFRPENMRAAAGSASPLPPGSAPAKQTAPQTPPVPVVTKPPGSYVIREVALLKEGQSQRGPWKLFKVVTDDGDFITFNQKFADYAEKLRSTGQPAEIKFKETKKGDYSNRDIENIFAADVADSPPESLPQLSPDPPSPGLPPVEDGIKVDATIVSVSAPRIAKRNGKTEMWFEIVTENFGNFYTNKAELAASLQLCKDSEHYATFWYSELGQKRVVTRVDETPF